MLKTATVPKSAPAVPNFESSSNSTPVGQSRASALQGLWVETNCRNSSSRAQTVEHTKLSSEWPARETKFASLDPTGCPTV